MLNVAWVKSKAQTWLEFQTFGLDSDYGDGVYIIWHAGNPGRVVYVGQGDIANRLECHRTNSKVTQYANTGKLYVTWANVPVNQIDGVERYLADTWSPLVGDAHPTALPIAVNSPW